MSEECVEKRYGGMERYRREGTGLFSQIVYHRVRGCLKNREEVY